MIVPICSDQLCSAPLLIQTISDKEIRKNDIIKSDGTKQNQKFAGEIQTREDDGLIYSTYMLRTISKNNGIANKEFIMWKYIILQCGCIRGVSECVCVCSFYQFTSV